MSAGIHHATRLGLTGGIGSGKSTVARMLVELGAALVDADQIARELTGAGGAAMADIARTFGADFLDATGALDRPRMREHAFAHPAARQQLEAIVHPLVGCVSEERVQAALAAGHRLVVQDIPLLIESGHWPRQLSAVLVVDCRESTQISRVVARSALAPAAVQAIMASQASRQQRRAGADIVLYNDGLSLPALQAQVRLVAQRFGL